MKIMLSNDDGIKAEGLNTLYESLKDIADVFVIAPAKEMSGAGSSITTRRPLKIEEIRNNFIAVNGTPVDCVHLGLHQLCPFKPDILLSGINFGANMAEDLLYSGTVGAAMEGRELSIPSMAISAAAFQQPGSNKKYEPNFLSAAQITRDMIIKFHELKIDPKVTLNINVPNLPYDKIKEAEVTTLGSWGTRNPPNKEILSSGQEQFWIAHRSNVPENSKNSDIETLARGAVSVTPLRPNFMVKDFSEEIGNWLEVVM